jgi:hypothetical protein
MTIASALIAVAALAATVAGCAGAQAPVLYPNVKFREVGPEQAQRDVEQCRAQAGQHVPSAAGKEIGRGAAVGAASGAAIGGVAGAVSGRGAGTGAAVGAATGATAGLMRSMLGGGNEPSQAYRNVVDRCLRERGYEPAGWD